jgi:hypothetical protein
VTSAEITKSPTSVTPTSKVTSTMMTTPTPRPKILTPRPELASRPTLEAAPRQQIVSNQAYPFIPPEAAVVEKNHLFCPPTNIHGLFFNWTEAGQMASVGCGLNFAGLAYLNCDSGGRWTSSKPDLSQCQSFWLQKLRGQLDKQASIVQVANDLAHYTSSLGPLTSGDLLLLIDTVEVMTTRMRSDLKTIPTMDQRRTVVVEVVQVRLVGYYVHIGLVALHNC